MKCEHDDCFTCPYPDCILGERHPVYNGHRRTREERLAYQREYYHKNKDRIRAQQKENARKRKDK